MLGYKLQAPGKAILGAATAILGWSFYRAYQTRRVHAEHFNDTTSTLASPGLPVPHYMREPSINKSKDIIVPPKPSLASDNKDEKVSK